MTKLLVIDVGNTHTVLGVYEGKTLLQHWRIQTEEGRTEDEYGVLIRSLLSGPEATNLGGVAVACVVPAMNVTITGATGLIGTKLVAALKGRGDTLTVLSRNPELLALAVVLAPMVHWSIKPPKS